MGKRFNNEWRVFVLGRKLKKKKEEKILRESEMQEKERGKDFTRSGEQLREIELKLTHSFKVLQSTF